MQQNKYHIGSLSLSENAGAHLQIVKSNIIKVIDGLDHNSKKKHGGEHDLQLSGQQRLVKKRGKISVHLNYALSKIFDLTYNHYYLSFLKTLPKSR